MLGLVMTVTLVGCSAESDPPDSVTKVERFPNFIPERPTLINALTDEEKADGWVLLWDGESADGWRSGKSQTFPAAGWSVSGGVIMVQGSDGSESTRGGDIITVRKYRNFVLELDFNITEGANSGIKYFVDPELNKGPGSSIGPEYQILDDMKHPDAKLGVLGNRTMGSLYDLITADARIYDSAQEQKPFKGIGTWNRARIEARNGRVAHYLNGVKILQYHRGTQMWRALVNYSKYQTWPNFGELEEGHILLQDHGDEVRFRNIKIKELD